MMIQKEAAAPASALLFDVEEDEDSTEVQKQGKGGILNFKKNYEKNQHFICDSYFPHIITCHA